MPALIMIIALASQLLLGLVWLGASSAYAQDPLPWAQSSPPRPESVPPGGTYSDSPANDAYSPRSRPSYDDAYRPPPNRQTYATPRGSYSDNVSPPRDGYADNGRYSPGYGQPYSAPPGSEYGEPYERGYGPPPYDGSGRGYPDEAQDGTYSVNEISEASRRFFGSVSQGLASVIEYAFQKQGRPNGYILGEDAGGAFLAGLTYGEGTLYTKDAGTHKVYWQGPSIGYDFGGAGSKVMVLVYNLRDPAEIYDRFGGVAGSAYIVGGVGLNFQAKNHIVLAPIRAGVGLRLGANIGYLKYTRRPTWNPF
jgi:hypothetical protein